MGGGWYDLMGLGKKNYSVDDLERGGGGHDLEGTSTGGIVILQQEFIFTSNQGLYG